MHVYICAISVFEGPYSRRSGGREWALKGAFIIRVVLTPVYLKDKQITIESFAIYQAYSQLDDAEIHIRV